MQKDLSSARRIATLTAVQTNRRNFIHSLGLAATLLQSRHAVCADAPPNLKPIGNVHARASSDIKASPLSIGFEGLDRKMFDPQRTYPHLAKLGAKWARVQTGWSRSEPVAGKYDFAWLDQIVDGLRGIGLQPWFSVGFGNRLYTPDSPDEFAIGWSPMFSEKAQQAWFRFVRALTGHFRGRVQHYEIWNEPNGKTFWKPGKPSASHYVELVKISSKAIREIDSSAIIIGGAIAGMETPFFEECMKAGMGEHVQKVSFHSYRFTPERNYEADVLKWRKIIAQHKPGIELWHGEVGAASQPGGAGGHADHPWTETRQGKWLLRRFLSDLRMNIELVSYYHTVDLVNYRTSEGPSTKTNFKGLLRGTDYTPKPAYFAYQCLCTLFDANTSRTELPIEFKPTPTINTADLVSASFVRKDKAMFVYWHPPGPEMERADEQVHVVVPSSAKEKLQKPVLIDPLTGTVSEIAKAEKSGGRWSFRSLPLADHPLILTDAAVVST